MQVQCSGCKSNYNIKNEKVPDAGAKIRCPKCQNVIRVKKAIPSSPPLPRSQSAHHNIKAIDHSTANGNKKSKKTVYIGSAVILLVVAAFAVYIFSSGPSQFEAKANGVRDDSKNTAERKTTELPNRSKSTTEGKTAEFPKKTKSSSDEVLIIKGLHIGMPIENAHSRLKELFAGNWEVAGIEHQEDGHWYTSAEDLSYGKSILTPALRIWGDPQTKQVIQIKFDHEAVDYLFNVSDMDGREFAQAFVNAYNIPSMEAKIQEVDQLSQYVFGDNPLIDTSPKPYWEYKDPRGVLIRIKENKELLIMKIAGSNERRFN